MGRQADRPLRAKMTFVGKRSEKRETKVRHFVHSTIAKLNEIFVTDSTKHHLKRPCGLTIFLAQ